MKSDDFLTDLEAAAAAQHARAQLAQVRSQVRQQRLGATQTSRLAASLGTPLSLWAGGYELTGTLIEVGDDWLALARTHQVVTSVADLSRAGTQIIRLAHVDSVAGLGKTFATDGDLAPPIALEQVFVALGRARSSVSWRTASGQSYAGTIDGVGADHVMLRRTQGDVVMLANTALVTLRVVSANASYAG